VLGLEAGAERGRRVVGIEVVLAVGDLHVVGLHQPPGQELEGLELAGRAAPLGEETLHQRVGDLVGAEEVVVAVELGIELKSSTRER
jgi:hypothetical protein